MAGPGYQNIITTDLVDDPMLTDNNIKTFTKAPVVCVSHALAFVKSFWPEAQLEMFAQGVAAE
jgi:hypothetical protein